MIDLYTLTESEGWTLIVDENAPDRPDILGLPQRDELCAQACKNNIIAIRPQLKHIDAFYAVSHEIAEARHDFTGHHQHVWREQCSILSRWCRHLTLENRQTELELQAVTKTLDDHRKRGLEAAE